jgi:hypothetical protein
MNPKTPGDELSSHAPVQQQGGKMQVRNNARHSIQEERKCLLI